MSFRRFRRSQAGPQPVHFNGVSQTVAFFDGGEALSPLALAAPRPLVHRSLEESVNAARPFFSWSGYGADQPRVSLRRFLRSPVVRVSAAVGPSLRHSPASQRRIKASWREFNALRANPRVAFCVRRHQRRETLFALKIAGRRGLGRKGVRRTEWSNWRC